MNNKEQESLNNHLKEDSKKLQTDDKARSVPFTHDFSFSGSQKWFLVLSAIVPLTVLLIQIANIVFIIDQPPPPPPPGTELNGNIINGITPLIIMVIMSIYCGLFLIFMLKWRNKARKFEKQKKVFRKMLEETQEEKEGTEFISYTQMSYENLKHMKRMRIVSYITSIAAILYIWWVIRGFLVTLGVILPTIPFNHPPMVLNAFNIIAQVILISYICYQWVFIHRWNRKLKRIKVLEKQVTKELEL